MRFKYTAIVEGNKRISGTAEAMDKFDLAHQLKSENKVLVSAEETIAIGESRLAFLNNIFNTVKMQEKIIFSRNLSAMIKAGLSLTRAISIMQRQTKNKVFKQITGEIVEHIRKGGTLSGGMEKFPRVFSSLFVSMVQAGEESGNLVQSLKVVSNQLEKAYELRRRIRGALIYPSIIIIAMVIVGILMLIFVVPTLTSTFKELGVELPASTRAVIFTSDFLAANTVITLFSITALIAFITLFFRTKRGKRIWHFSVLYIPIIGSLVKKTNAARTTRTLSSLLSSGVDMVEALRITEDVLQNSYYKEVVARSAERIQKGAPLSETFSQAEKLYPILVGEIMEVGEETGALSTMLLEIATFYEDEVGAATKNMATIIEPFLMILVGIVVGFFAIAMISPTYSLLESI